MIDFIPNRVVLAVNNRLASVGIVTLNDRHNMAQRLRCTVDEIDAAIELTIKKQAHVEQQ